MMRRWLLAIFCCVFVGWLTLPGLAWGQNAATSEAAPPALKYQNVFVPATPKEHLERELAGSTQKYLPVLRTEFEKLVAAANVSPLGPRAAQVRLTDATYSARLQGSDLVSGVAKLQIQHRLTEPSLLPLDPCTLAIRKPRWQAQTETPARLGTDAAGRLCVLLPDQPGAGATTNEAELHTAELRFDWSLRGARDPSGALVFAIQTPACPTTTLQLALLPGLTPLVSHGVVARDVAADRDEQHMWRIKLGGRSQTTLSIVASDAVGKTQRYVLLKKAATYEVTPQALEATFDLKLDIYHEPLRQLSFQLSNDLQVTSVLSGDKEIPWNITSSANHVRKATIEFAEPLQGVDRTLRITAVAPLTWDRSYRLPDLHAEGVLWQEGTIWLAVPAALELRDVVATGCRQTKISHQAGARPSELHQFQCFSPEAQLTIIAGQPALRLQAKSGLTLKWEGADLAGRLVTDLVALQGQTFKLDGQVPEGWTIDHVEAVPAEALDDWSLAVHNGQPTLLTVRFAQAITAQRGVRLIVQGHRRAPSANETLTPAGYRLASFRQVSEQRQLVSIEAEAEQQLGLLGDVGLERLDPSTLADADAALLDVAASRLLFVDEITSSTFGLNIRTEKPRYAAQIQLTAQVDTAAINESYRIRCTPEATSLARVLIHISPERAVPLAWELVGEANAEFSARRWSEAERKAEALPDGETWELTLQRPRSTPFELAAKRVTPFTGDITSLPLALAAAPEAESQTGAIEVHALPGANFTLDAQGVKSQLPAATEQQAASTLRASYAYQPTQEQRLLVHRLPRSEQPASAWVWRSLLTSRVSASGRCVHSLRYELENAGRSDLRATLPAGTLLHEVHVNGERITTVHDAHTGSLSIPLPSTVRYCAIVMEYEENCPTQALISRLHLQLPKLDIPVLVSQARVCLPASLAVADNQHPNEWGWNAQGDWRVRLFGPLARPAGVAPFELLSLRSWRSQFDDDRISPTQRAAGAACLQAWEQLLAPQREAGRAQTLGEWAQRYDRLANDSASNLPRLRIDQVALAQAGWYGESRLPAVSADAPSTTNEMLRNAGLIFALQAGEVRLTTREHLLLEHEHWLPLVPSVIAVENKSFTGDPLPPRAADLRVAAWLAQPQVARAPWPVPSRIDLAEFEAAGWQVYQFAISDDAASVPLVVYRARDLQAIAWGLFLAVIAGVYWVARRWRTWLLAVGIAALVALILPAPLLAIGTALFLGTLVAGVCLLVGRQRLRPTVSAPLSTMTHAVPRVLAKTAPLGLLCLGGWSLLSAQEVATLPTAEVVYRVLVPIDEDQQPVGDYVHVPRPLYEALFRMARANKSTPQGWLLYDATYRGRLQWEMLGGKLQFSDLAVVYDLEVFQPGTTVTIGLGRENVQLLDEHINLDDQAAPIQWLENGEGFTFLVEKAGRYRLELALKPTPRSIGAREEIDVRIPRLASSQLLLKMPADAVGILVPRALGAQSVGEGNELQVDLGPADRLTVSWRTPESPDATNGGVEAAQLLWWKIRPGATVLEATWRFKSTNQPLREVRLVADPRLRLLPLDPKSPVAEQFIRDGDVKAIQFVLKEPYEREVTLHTTFSLVGSSGIGSLTLPQLEAVADRTTRRWLAVSTSATLDARLADNMAIETLTPQEFLTSWGEAEATPQATYRLPLTESLVAFSVQPREPQITGEQTLRYLLGSQQTQIEFDATLAVAEGHTYLHHLKLPPGMRVDSVALEQEEAQRVARFAFAAPDLLTIFLPSATTGSYRLKLLGALATPLLGDSQLPLLQLQELPATPVAIAIERSHDVAVTIPEGIAGFAPATNDPLPFVVNNYRRVATLQPQPDAASAIPVQITAVQPELRAQQITHLLRDGEAWRTSVDCFGQISSGGIDFLRWEIPGDWDGPFRLNVPAVLEVIDVPRQSRKQLVARLQTPLTGEFHVQLSAPLAVDPGERLQVPELALLDAQLVESYVVLPTLDSDQQITWETRGLQAVEMPPARREQLPESAQAYLVVGARYQASAKRLERVSGAPRVSLADVQIATAPENGLFGVAAFDIEPAGLTHCHLEVPAGYRLLHVTIAGLPAVMSPIDETHWQLPLHHDQLPQHIEVLFQAPASDTKRSEFTAPSLVALPVERWLWTVYSADHERRLRLGEPENAVDASRQTMMRLKHSQTLLDQAATILAESDAHETTAWFIAWSRRSATQHALFAQLEAQRATPSVSLSNELQTLANAVQASAQQLGTTELTAQAFKHSAQSDQATDLLRQVAADSVPLLATQTDASPRLPIDTIAKTPGGNWSRWITGFVIAGLLLTFVWLAKLTMLDDLAARWPHIFGVLAGIAWWYLLQPSILGIAMVLLFTLSALRWPWPRNTESLATPLVARIARPTSRR